jgi:ubiquinone/menaquinone biosynthesis C-methylase UbiE
MPTQTRVYVYGVSTQQILTALPMTIRRRHIARALVDAAQLGPSDQVIDIGCGLGTAVRLAARRSAVATGIDPAPGMLILARWLSAFRRSPNISWLPGHAEKLPVLGGQATVAWAASSFHHWTDRAAGLAEASRALAPAGRLLIVERLAPTEQPHARGITNDGVDAIIRQVTEAGFLDVRTRITLAGSITLVIVSAAKPPAWPTASTL